MDDWESRICPSIGHHATLSFRDLEREGPPSRPLDFPSPIVHKGTRITVHAYDSKRGEYHKMKNVLIKSRRGSSGGSQDYINVMRTKTATGGRADKDKESENDVVGYCLRKKIANTVYGGVYKGIVLKKRDLLCGEEAVIQDALRERTSKSTRSLTCILEDLELNDKSTKENTVNCATPKGSNAVWEITDQHVIIKVRNMFIES